MTMPLTTPRLQAWAIGLAAHILTTTILAGCATVSPNPCIEDRLGDACEATLGGDGSNATFGSDEGGSDEGGSDEGGSETGQGSRSGLGDGTNPGQGRGREKSPNDGTDNPGEGK